MVLIVDGNNVTRALGLRRPPQVEQFLLRLELAAARRDWEATVVFDGPERFLRRESGPLVVRYAQGKSADAVIERMVYQAPDRAQVVVATHDRAEADLVCGFGARVWSARQLEQELE